MSLQVFHTSLPFVFQVGLSTVGLLLAVVFLSKFLVSWKDRAVQRALVALCEQQRSVHVSPEKQDVVPQGSVEEEKQEELSRVSEEESYPDWMKLVLEGKYDQYEFPPVSEEKSRQHEVEGRLNVLLQKQLDFSNILHATTSEEQDDLWMQLGEHGTPVLPEAHRPFYTELNGIARCLWDLNSHLARVEQEDLDFYQKWLEELEFRFGLFKTLNDQHSLQRILSDLREQHEEMGKRYGSASLNRTYQLFLGMLFIIEKMVDDNLVPAQHLRDYVLALSKQQQVLLKSFEQRMIS